MSEGAPASHERILWIVVCALAWKYAQSVESMGLARDSTAAILIFVSGYGLGLAALAAALSSSAARIMRGPVMLALFAFCFLSFGIGDALSRERSAYTFTTDAHVYMDYAARVLLKGRNPYGESLYGAYQVHVMPTGLQTPLSDGGLSDRLAYPSLSFLVLVPFVGLGIDTRYAYALAFLGCIAVIYFAAPKNLRTIVLLPFLANETFMAYSFGGVTDSFWALFLGIAALTWKRRLLPAIFFGLACAFKQHAWLLIPFLAVRIFVEQPRGARGSALARFFGIAGGVALALNLPFIVWGPRAWFLGIVESLTASMVPLGEGLSAFVVFSGLAVPKVLFTVVFWSLYVGLIVVCARWRHGRWLVWIAPSIAFFFNYRSLSSYWLFNILPFVVDLAHDPPPVLTATSSLTRKRALGVCAVAVVVAIAAGLWARSKGSDIELTILDPTRTWASHAKRMDLRLKNHGTRSIHPRFWIQGVNFQPLPWRIDSGPPELGPGDSAEYSISAMHRISEFDIDSGARLTVTDLRSDARTSITIEPDAAWASPFAIANAQFRYWDVGAGAPAQWGVTEEGSPGASAAPAHDRDGVVLRLDPDPSHVEAERQQFCLALPSCYAASVAGPRSHVGDRDSHDHVVRLVSDFTYHDGTVTILANPPPGANVVPELAVRYGVEISIDAGRETLLLGGEPSTGTFPGGEPFRVLPGPRGAWTRYEIDLHAIKEDIAKRSYPSWNVIIRLPLVDIPSLPAHFALVLASKSNEPVEATFGTVSDGIVGKQSPTEAFAELEKHRGQIDSFRSDYEMQLGNPARAATYAGHAALVESHPALTLRAAKAALQTGDFEAADRGFTEALDTYPVEARLGLGWAKLAKKDFDEAARRFSEGRILISARAEKETRAPTGDEELQTMNASVGLAIAKSDQGNCAAARDALKNLPDLEQKHARSIPELVSCFELETHGDAGPR